MTDQQRNRVGDLVRPTDENMAIRRVGIGTVQFGLDYGISNCRGRTTPDEVERILARAAAMGVSLLDTAPAYGASEDVLGAAHVAGRFRIVTKTPSIVAASSQSPDPSVVESTLRRSLRRLGVSSVYGLLVHEPQELLGPAGAALHQSLLAVKAAGLVQKIGVSTYTPHEVDMVLDRYAIDLIQVPLNVLDQRLLQGGHLQRLKRAGVEIHVRSAFLQGLLLMTPDEVGGHFDTARERLSTYRRTLEQDGLSPLQAALGFVLGVAEVDSVICGVNDAAQFAEIANAAIPLHPERFAQFACNDESTINPALWPPRGMINASR